MKSLKFLFIIFWLIGKVSLDVILVRSKGRCSIDILFTETIIKDYLQHFIG